MDADAAALGVDQRWMRPRGLRSFRLLEATPELVEQIDEHNVMGRAPESFEAFFEFEYGDYRHDDGAGLLFDYVNIDIELEDKDFTSLFELPASRSLPRLCPHLLPVRHCNLHVDAFNAVFDPDALDGPFRIPIDALLFYGRLFREITDAGREIATFATFADEVSNDSSFYPGGVLTTDPSAMAHFIRQIPEESRTGAAFARRIVVGEILRFLSLWSGLGISFWWIGDVPEQHYTASDPVIGTLTVQAYEYLRHAESHVCECGRVVDMTGRRRRPQRNRRVWCYKCRAEGRDRLAVEKRRAERKRGKRG